MAARARNRQHHGARPRRGHRSTALADRLRETVLDPLEAEMEAARATRAAKAAATKVDFFTMTRGED